MPQGCCVARNARLCYTAQPGAVMHCLQRIILPLLRFGTPGLRVTFAMGRFVFSTTTGFELGCWPTGSSLGSGVLFVLPPGGAGSAGPRCPSSASRPSVLPSASFWSPLDPISAAFCCCRRWNSSKKLPSLLNCRTGISPVSSTSRSSGMVDKLKKILTNLSASFQG